MTERENLVRQNQTMIRGINLERRVALRMLLFNRARRKEAGLSDHYAWGYYSAGIGDSLAYLKGLRAILRRAGIHK